MTRRPRTPRQAGSARSLDRWEREVLASLSLLENGHLVDTRARCALCRLHRRLTRLLASIQTAERR